MSDQEFDVMDELYFVQSFDEVMEAADLEEEMLKQVLQGLMEKGWIRCMQSREGEVNGDKIDFHTHFKQYFYLATKKGLLAHNSR